MRVPPELGAAVAAATVSPSSRSTLAAAERTAGFSCSCTVQKQSLLSLAKCALKFAVPALLHSASTTASALVITCEFSS
jgi:hypothetical protein